VANPESRAWACSIVLAIGCTAPPPPEPEPEPTIVEAVEREPPLPATLEVEPPPPEQQTRDPGGFRCFAPPIKTSINHSPFGMRNADVNADGLLDLIGVSSELVAGVFERSINVYLGQPNGRFIHASKIPYAGGGLETAFADFTGDGLVDLLIGNMDQPSFSIWRGDGQGHFTHDRDHQTGAKPREPQLGDLDGDGNLDLVLPRHRTVEIHLNLGGGRFRKQATLTTAASEQMSTPENLSIADVDGDGNLDLVIPLSDDGAIEVWLGRGDGRFKRHVRYDEVCSSPAHSVLGHFDGDEHLDLVLGCSGLERLFVAAGDGKGGFAWDRAQQLELPGAPSEIVAVQLHGDETPELIVGGRIRTLGAGHPRPRGFLRIFAADGERLREWDGATVDAHVVHAIGVRDLDGDGRLDIIYAATGQVPGSHLATALGRGCDRE
jgi:hypothetical protein